MLASAKFCVLLLFTLVLRVNCVPGTFDGGASGDDQSNHIIGTPTTKKLTPGLVCYKQQETDTDFDVDFYIYESDTGLKDEDKTTYIHFGQCEFLDAKKYFNGNMRAAPTTTCSMNRIGTDPAITEQGIVAQRMWKKTVTDQDTAANDEDAMSCGGVKKAGDLYKYVVHCQRTNGYDKLYDQTFVFTCDESKLLVRQHESQAVPVSLPPFTKVSREYAVVFEAFVLTAGSTIPVPKVVASTTSIRNPASDGAYLGESYFFQMCLESDSTAFFEDGVSILGLQITDCKVTLATSSNAFGGTAAVLDVSDTNGCGKEADPFEEASKSKRFMVYKDDNVVGTKLDHLRSPNCWQSNLHEVVSIARKNKGNVVNMKLTCSLKKFCTQYSDTDCFGDEDESCPTARRRRDITVSNESEKLSTEIVIINAVRPSEANKQRAECFEQLTFVSLIVVLAVLLLVVLAVAVFLAMRIRSLGREDQENSVSGFANKGYQ